ncbi:hypothetical protein Y032_0233g3105 [Ancylostoma ceylanicum]|uniref:Uncharacterized protein n=1 Tax=Ancylostoma ceylanicum TaxID=53326 RepID=A0A016SFE0_9BILA|nr:hypothetical protein Y032_0233g3105 [Ancylostoma ceylanicum]
MLSCRQPRIVRVGSQLPKQHFPFVLKLYSYIGAQPTHDYTKYMKLFALLLIVALAAAFPGQGSVSTPPAIAKNGKAPAHKGMPPPMRGNRTGGPHRGGFSVPPEGFSAGPFRLLRQHKGQ